MLTMKQTLKGIVPAALLLAATAAAAAPFCGELTNGFGPYDYREPPPDSLYLVESAHYTEEVAAGVKGNTGTIGGDLDYTLRAFPNHIKALTSMAMVAARTKVNQVYGAKYPVECYFERAVRFKPDDGLAWGAYGKYLYGIGEVKRAMPMLEKAFGMVPDNPSISYNLGIAYFRAKQFDLAVKHARIAYQHDFPLDGLRNMLVRAGKWDGKVEPLPAKNGEPQEKDDAGPKDAPKKDDGGAKDGQKNDDAGAKDAPQTAAR